MRLIAHLRSSAALLLVVLLSGSTALSLALCASEGGHARCAVQMPRPSASQDGCHRPQLPALNLSCCCDGDNATTPMGAPGTTDIAGTAKSPTVFPVGARAGTDAGIRAGETALAPTHTRPLFTLYSTFLI